MNTLPAPLWLLAAPFSGVSWLAASLGRHPDLFVTPELDLLLADTLADALDIFAIGQGTQGHGLLRLVAWLEFQQQDDAGIRQAQAWLEERREWTSAALLHYLMKAVAPRRLVIPERDATLRPMALIRLQRALPQSQILHLVRHPWEQGVLLHAWATERLYVSVDFRDYAQDPALIEPQLPWLRANQNIENLCSRLGEGRSLRICAEQLEQAPADVMEPLCEWLGCSADASALAAMQQPERWRFSAWGPDLAPGGLEAEAFEQWSAASLALLASGNRQGPLPWRTDGAGFAPQVRACAQRYGYAMEAVEPG